MKAFAKNHAPERQPAPSINASNDESALPPLLKPDPTDNLPPPLLVPESPLIRWLRHCSPEQRRSLRRITLTRALGYTGGLTFADGEHLYRWLTPHEGVYMGTIWRAELHRIKTFKRPITRRLMLAHCRDVDRRAFDQ